MSEWSLQIAGWLLTFALHSTILLGGVWLACRIFDLERVEDQLWKLVTVGSVVTTSLAGVGAWIAVPGLQIDLAAVVPALESTISSPTTPELSAAPIAMDAATISELVAPWFDLSVVSWCLLIYAGLVVGLSVWKGLRATRTHRLLASRQEVIDAELLSRIAQLRIAAGLRRPVRLSCNEALRSPIAFGLLHSEISVPPVVLHGMDRRRQECVLGHEIAHLVHRDAWWQLAFATMRCLFFFQPLIQVAQRRTRELAEYRCDAWVVAHTGDRIEMANALVEVAGWLVEGDAPPHGLVSTMARGDSPLRHRVQRILDAEVSALSRRTRLVLLPLLAAALLAASYAVPGVQLSRAEAPPSSMQTQLATLEGEIADLHQQLAIAWRKLDGRDRPEFVAMLQAFDQHLQDVNKRYRVLSQEASAATTDSIPVETPKPQTHSAR